MIPGLKYANPSVDFQLRHIKGKEGKAELLVTFEDDSTKAVEINGKDENAILDDLVSASTGSKTST